MVLSDEFKPDERSRFNTYRSRRPVRMVDTANKKKWMIDLKEAEAARKSVETLTTKALEQNIEDVANAIVLTVSLIATLRKISWSTGHEDLVADLVGAAESIDLVQPTNSDILTTAEGKYAKEEKKLNIRSLARRNAEAIITDPTKPGWKKTYKSTFNMKKPRKDNKQNKVKKEKKGGFGFDLSIRNFHRKRTTV